MARVTHVKKAQQRYKTVPVIDPATGKQKVTPVLRKDGSQKMTRAKANKPARPIVMRVTVADKSQPLPNIKCEKCGTEIKPGMPYKHCTPKSGPYGGRQRNRCESCPSWRPSETTSSPNLSTLYAAQEAADDAMGAWDAEDGADALREILTNLAEGVREAGEGYEESAQNMEDGFGHETGMSAELREKAEALTSAADEIESTADQIEEWDEDSATSEVEGDHPLEDFQEEGVSDEEAELLREKAIEEAVEEKKQEWAEEQSTVVNDAMQVDF